LRYVANVKCFFFGFDFELYTTTPMTSQQSQSQYCRLQDMEFMQERDYQKPVRDINELKQHLIETQKSIIDETIDQ